MTIDEPRAMLKPYDADLMTAYEVSRAVNSVKNDTPECVEPYAEWRDACIRAEGAPRRFASCQNEDHSPPRKNSLGTQAVTDWEIHGQMFTNCSCAYGCPCQFNALPTHGYCRAVVFVQIDKGHFGDKKLDGLNFAFAVAWPGAVHQGRGKMQPIIDERGDAPQREALLSILTGSLYRMADVDPNQQADPTNRSTRTAPAHLGRASS